MINRSVSGSFRNSSRSCSCSAVVIPSGDCSVSVITSVNSPGRFAYSLSFALHLFETMENSQLLKASSFLSVPMDAHASITASLTASFASSACFNM